MVDHHDTPIHEQLDELRLDAARSKRRLRLAVAGLLALMLVINVAPVAASHLTVRSSDIVDGAVKTPDLHNGSVKSHKIYNGAVKTPDIANGSVGHNKLGNQTIAARAYGTVWWSGNSVTNNRNLVSANVTRPATGVYCISGLSFAPTNVIATPSYGWNAFLQDVHVWSIGTPTGGDAPCAAGTQIQVRLYDPGTSTLSNGNFNIVIF